MNSPNLASPSWYPSPFSRRHDLMRWWDGSAWTSKTRIALPDEDMLTGVPNSVEGQRGQTPDSASPIPLSHHFQVINYICVGLTFAFLLFNFGILFLGVLEVLFAMAITVLGISMLVARRHGRAVSVGSVILQITLGACGIGWFAWTAIDATLAYASRR